MGCRFMESVTLRLMSDRRAKGRLRQRPNVGPHVRHAAAFPSAFFTTEQTACDDAKKSHQSYAMLSRALNSLFPFTIG